MRVVDIFSGYGGFSQPFLDRGHDVIRYDFDPRFKSVPNTVIQDVMTLNSLPACDIVLASPPCNCFSIMTIRYYWKNGQPDERAQAAIALVQKAIRLIHSVRPVCWVLENPNGMLVRVLGKPAYRTWWAAWYSQKDTKLMDALNGAPVPLKPTNLWGVLPELDWPKKPVDGYAKISRNDPMRQKGIQGIKDRAVSSMVPYAFSEALCLAMENRRLIQKTLGSE